MIAMTMFAWGATVYFDQYKPPENAIEVYVVGKQWMWKVARQLVNAKSTSCMCPSAARSN